MKKLIVIAVLCLSLTVGAFALDFSVKASGGMSLLFGGDYNAAAQGQNDLFKIIPGIVINSEFKKLSMGLDFGAEFILQFTDRLGLGLGVGYITASNDSTLAGHYGLIGITINRKPNVSIIPVTLSFHYFLPLNSSFKLHFFGGPGLYLTSVKFDSTLIATLGPIEEEKGVLVFTPDSKAVPGFQGGAGLEFDLSGNISWLLDAAGRYLSISSISGPGTLDGHIGIIPIHITATGTLYYYEEAVGGNYYGNIAVSNTMPLGSNAREASISLSGIQFQTGIRIRF